MVYILSDDGRPKVHMRRWALRTVETVNAMGPLFPQAADAGSRRQGGQQVAALLQANSDLNAEAGRFGTKHVPQRRKVSALCGAAGMANARTVSLRNV